MKKLFALMLALCLCATLVVASAETESDVLEAPEVSFEAAKLKIADDGLAILVPSNVEISYMEDNTPVFTVPDIGLSMVIQFAGYDLADIISLKESQGYNVFNFTANEITYIVTGLEADGQSTANAMITMGDSLTLVITFTYPTSYTGSVIPEILSTLGYYED